jgi:hypothetical protein
MEIGQGKVFYKPEAGMYLGKIIDIVEKPGVVTKYGPKNKVMIVWTITQMSGQQYLDPEGQPFQATAYVTATIQEKSTQPFFRNLFKIIYGILGGQPPLITSTAQLEQLLLGRANGLMLTKEPNPEKQGDFYVNIVGIMPLGPGQPIPPTPTGFVRAKDRPKVQAGPNGQPVATYQQNPAAQPASTQAAPQPTQPTNNVQF